MNRTEIEAKWNTLTPRERDAWIAEVVFGYYWEDLFPHMKSERKIRMLVPPIGNTLRGVGGNVDLDGIPDNLPYYTTDIAAAWTVVDEINQHVYFKLYRSSRRIYSEENWRCNFGTNEVNAPTPAVAICLAAIIAKLSEVSE